MSRTAGNRNDSCFPSQVPKPDHDPSTLFWKYGLHQDFPVNWEVWRRWGCWQGENIHSKIVCFLCSFDTWAKLQPKWGRAPQDWDVGRDNTWCFAPSLGLARRWAQREHSMLFKNDVLIRNTILSNIRLLEEEASLILHSYIYCIYCKYSALVY